MKRRVRGNNEQKKREKKTNEEELKQKANKTKKKGRYEDGLWRTEEEEKNENTLQRNETGFQTNEKIRNSNNTQ